MTKLESIKKHGISAEGRRELMNYLKGKDLAMKQAILARCYDCMSFYADGIADCKTLECPLYMFMPYRKVRRARKTANKKAVKLADKKNGKKKAVSDKSKPAQKKKAARAPIKKKRAPQSLSLFKA